MYLVLLKFLSSMFCSFQCINLLPPFSKLFYFFGYKASFGCYYKWIAYLKETLLSLLALVAFFACGFFVFSKYRIISTGNKFCLFPSNVDAYISCSCLLTLAKTSRTMFNSSGKSRHPCSVPVHREKLSFFHYRV